MSDYETEQYDKYIIGSLANMAKPPVDETKGMFDQTPLGAIVGLTPQALSENISSVISSKDFVKFEISIVIIYSLKYSISIFYIVFNYYTHIKFLMLLQILYHKCKENQNDYQN